MNILVHSAAGGVGGALLQLGKIAGCRMTGVVGSTHKVDTALNYGADQVIDKSKENLWGKARELCPDGYDAVFDANGPATLKQSYQLNILGRSQLLQAALGVFPGSAMEPAGYDPGEQKPDGL